MSFLSVQWKENLPAFCPYDTHNKTRLEVAISYKSLYKIEACMLTCGVLSHPSLQCTTTEVRHLSTASAILTAPARMTWKLVLYVRTAWLKCSIYAAVKKNHMKFLPWLLRYFLISPFQEEEKHLSRVRTDFWVQNSRLFPDFFPKQLFLFPDSRLSNRWSIETL